MVKIYCIEDCNGLKYVGSTIKTFKKRLSQHKSGKKKTQNCSSKKLDLDNCRMYELEECPDENRIEREKYWISQTDCVNEMKYDFNRKEWDKECNKKYRENNKEYIKEYKKKKYNYRKSWGGDERTQNNLLLINIESIFL